MPISKKNGSAYFSFTRKERTGIIVIVTLILLFALLPFFYPYFISSKPASHAAFEKEIAALKMKEQDSVKGYAKRNYRDENDTRYYRTPGNNYPEQQPRGELFYFDPNTLSEAGWKKLGLRDKTINTIMHYVSKGGRFRTPEDIGKIWGLHADEVQRLTPFVAIKAAAIAAYAEKKNVESRSYEKKEYRPVPVDVNSADTSAFIALPGIGSKLANRIIAFRDKLGGFYKTGQVAETFALPDSTFQKIKDRLVISNAAVKQVHINTATVDELKAHPYIRYALANAIVQYRSAHGNFSSVADIKKIMIVTDDVYNKLAPYLTVQ